MPTRDTGSKRRPGGTSTGGTGGTGGSTRTTRPPSGTTVSTATQRPPSSGSSTVTPPPSGTTTSSSSTRQAKPRGSGNTTSSGTVGNTGNPFASLLNAIAGGGEFSGMDFSSLFGSLMGPAFAGAPKAGYHSNGIATTIGGDPTGISYTISPASETSPYIGLVDPRTDLIRATEAAGFLPTVMSLLNPQWLSNSVAQTVGRAPSRQNAGAEGQYGGTDLFNWITGGQSQAQALQIPWTQPGTRPSGGYSWGTDNRRPPPVPGGPPQRSQMPPTSGSTTGTTPTATPTASLQNAPLQNLASQSTYYTEPVQGLGTQTFQTALPGLMPQSIAQTAQPGDPNWIDPRHPNDPWYGWVTDLATGGNVLNPNDPRTFTQLLNAVSSVQTAADGGPLSPTDITIVGEAGPEAIVPTQQGQQVVPLTGAGMDPMQLVQMLMGAGAQGMATGGLLENSVLGPPDPDATVTTANASNSTLGATTTSTPMPPPAPNTSPLGIAANINPEMDAFNQMKLDIAGGWGGQANDAFGTAKTSLSNMLDTNPGQGVVNAMQPVFQNNLSRAFQQLQSSAPSIFNSAQQLQGTDLGRQALQDFNLTAAQALQQGVSQQQNAAQILGGLGQNAANADLGLFNAMQTGAQSAGQGQFGRLLGAGQLGLQGGQLQEQARQFNLGYDLQAQNQAYNQQMGPTLQLLLAAMGLAEPTGLQTVVGSQKG